LRPRDRRRRSSSELGYLPLPHTGQDKYVPCCWDSNPPTLWLVELLNWTGWSRSADSFAQLYMSLFTSLKTLGIVISREDLYFYFFPLADTRLCKVPCFLSGLLLGILKPFKLAYRTYHWLTIGKFYWNIAYPFWMEHESCVEWTKRIHFNVFESGVSLKLIYFFILVSIKDIIIAFLQVCSTYYMAFHKHFFD